MHLLNSKCVCQLWGSWYWKMTCSRSKNWTCSVCNISNSELLPDTAPHHQQNNQDNLPDFSFSYKSANSNSNTTTTTTTTTTSSTSNEQRDEIDQPSQSQQHTSSSVENHDPSAIPSQSNDSPATSSLSQSTGSIPIQQPVTSTTLSTHTSTRRPPLWLDGLIGVLIALLVTLIVRRFLWRW